MTYVNSHRFAAGGSPWSPTVIVEDILAWWDPGVGVSFHSGTDVATWTDKVQSRVLNAEVGTPPTFSSTGLNSLPILTFESGSNARMYGDYVYTGVPFMCFTVMRYANAGNANGRYISHGNTTLTTDFQQSDTWSLVRNASTDEIGVNRNNATVGSATPGYDTWIMLMVVFDGTTETLYLDDAVVGTPTSNSAAFGTNRLALFYSADSTLDNDFGRGRIADVITMHRAPTTAERNKFFGWAAHRYGLTSRLDVSHPYKSSPPTV